MAYSVIMMLPHEGLSKTIGHMESRWWVYGKKKKRRVPSPYDGTGYTPIYQSADAKKRADTDCRISPTAIPAL